MELKEMQDWAKNIIAKDAAERNLMWQRITDTYHLVYANPEAAKDIEGYHRVVKPQPYKDIMIAENALLEATPRCKIDPWSERFAGKEVANKREQALKWWFAKADEREDGSVLADMVRSAALYLTVCVQTSHVRYAARAEKDLLGKQAQYRAQHGPFSLTVHNPMDVHWQTSKHGLERVLSVRVVEIQDILDTWGAKAQALRTKLDASRGKDTGWKFQYGTEYYYCDLEKIVVWVIPTATATANPDAKDSVVVLDEPNELGFIPWAIKSLSSKLESNGKFKTKPLLWYIVESGSWQTDCTLASLQMTKAIQNAGKPDFIHSGPATPEAGYSIDYKELIGGVIEEMPGHTLRETQPAKFDVGLSELQRQLGSYQSETGVSEALAGNAQAETYSGQSLLMSAGRASIAGMKTVTERSIAEIWLQMLQWIKVNGEPERAKLTEPGNVGEEYELIPEELDVARTYITCELNTENPGTRIQQANVGAIAKQLGLSNETAQEWMGIDNPLGEMKKRTLEEFVAFKQQEFFKMQAAQTDMQIQQAQMKMQMQAQQQMMRAQQPQQPPPPDPMSMGGDAGYYDQQSLTPPTPEMGYDIQGQGYNAAAGGIPPAQVNPGATFEGQTGMTRSGGPAL